MGFHGKDYNLEDTGEKATEMRKKWLGDFADVKCQLAVDHPGEGEDEKS